MHAHRVRLFVGFLAAGLFAFALAVPGLEQDGNQGAPKRASTAPPMPPGGKLGQELFLAIDHRDLEEVKTLLKSGADPNAYNGLGFSPLYIASASHQLGTMQALLDAGARVDALSTYGTALTFAAGSGNAPGVKLLLGRGADPSMDRTDGITVLMMAANVGSPDIVGDLLERKVNVNVQDENGTTALAYAARGGFVPVVKALLDAGAEVGTPDHEGRTALMGAAINGHAEVVRMLLKKGGSIDARDAGGRTALMLAAAYGDHPAVVEALIAGGADRKATDAKGRTAADLAIARGHTADAAALGAKATSGTPGGRSAKDAVEASLALLQGSMAKFSQQATCVSCHQEGLGRIVTGAARKAGFHVDEAVNQAQVGRIEGMLQALRPLHEGALQNPELMKQLPLIEINEVVPIDAWLLAGMAEQNQPKTDQASAMAKVLARQQGPDGAWRFSMPRVPMQSSFFTFTALAVRGLDTFAPADSKEEVAERIARAKAWLESTPAKTSEDRAGRLLGLKWAGASEGALRKAVADVLADQRADGGWAQLPELQSDAYATGQALYALRVGGGVSGSDLRVQRGVRFLLRTQDDDGSWFVNKRAFPANNYFDAGFPHGQSQYASFNATCWATLALLLDSR